jgi:hypothetical protein
VTLFRQMHNQAAVDALVGADIVVIPLQGNEVKVKATLDLLLESASAPQLPPGTTAEGTTTPPPPRTVIAVSSIATWGRTPVSADGAPLTERDEPRRGVVPGAAKATADAERLVLRASSSKSGPGCTHTLETYVICPGLLYGAGEFPHGFLAPMRAAWEGRPVPVFGGGNNKLPVCHAHNLAATVVAVAERAMAGRGPPSSGRYVLAVDGGVGGLGGVDGDSRSGDGYRCAAPTQIEVAAAIAAAFGVGLVQMPASAVAVAAIADPGMENLLLDARVAATEEVAAEARPTHHGGFGAGAAAAADHDDSAADADASHNSPPLVGGMPAIVAQFLEANNLTPLRVVIRGPPLSFADELAAATAAAYSLPLLTPTTLLSAWIHKLPEERRRKLGVEAQDGEDAAATFKGLGEEVKVELLRAALGDEMVRRVGYVMAGGLPGGAAAVP